MHIKRRFTREDANVFDMFEYKKRKSVLKNPDGTLVFKMDEIEAPKEWSQMATDVLAQKYIRRTGVPQFDPDGNPILDENGEQKLGSETSVKQVAHRMAGCWRDWGEKHNYFDSPADAQAYYDEMVFMLLNQMGAPNSPQWFNTGLNYAYGITGHSQGHYFVNPETGELERSKDAYSRPQPHACFIQSVEDDLVNEGGIFDLAMREARVFKYGSGSGTNFSTLRGEGEKLSGGGVSSGLMSFLKIFDRAAGAIKSGGTTRRAAKMVIVDVDHPDVEKFIEWKAKEEEKVAALVSGSKIIKTFLGAIVDEAASGGTDRKTNSRLNALIQRALHRGVPLNYIKRVIDLVDQGYSSLDFDTFTTHYEDEAYVTVGGQNSNNSVRVTNAFMKAVENDEMWELTARTTGETVKAVKARDLWEKINMSAWKAADPGLQFDTTINEWHTCPQSGRINASNPCSEYMFLDDTACNLASLNLLKFLDEQSGNFNVEDFKHAVRLWTLTLEISVLMAQFPAKTAARKSYDFRTLGLGYANLGSLLMVGGIPYDSPEALALAGAISALMTGEAYVASSEMAKELGAFPEYEKNAKDMLRVIRNHRRAALNASSTTYEELTVKPMGIDHRLVDQDLLAAARDSWDRALESGEKYGFRNAQVSVLAPTGTIGLVMDCDTTGIEPDYAIVKMKKLAGGGYFKLVNQSVRRALYNLEYTEREIEDIEKYCKGRGSLVGCPHINRKSLKAKGFDEKSIQTIEGELDNVFELKYAFNAHTLGEDIYKKCGFSEEQINDPSFDMLTSLGFTHKQIEEANDYVCGSMTVEGAPGLRDEHLPIFDTANKCGRKGKRYIDRMAHVRMMAAVQPFISGAISKTVNMPEGATSADVGDINMRSWKHMIKAIAIYRDGSKLSQPLTSTNFADMDEIVMLGDENTLDETIGPKEVQENLQKRIRARAVREKLPKKRHGYIREAYVGGHKVYLRTGEYKDGSLGEIFIDMYKEGASFRGLLNSFAILASKALQYGIPVDELVDSFTFTRFEPAGYVEGHEAIRYSTSILDYVFRSIGYDYLDRSDFVHVKAVDELPSDRIEPSETGETRPEKPSAKEKSESSGRDEAEKSSAKSEANPTQTQTVAEEEPARLMTTDFGGNGSSEKSIKKRAPTFDPKIGGYTGEQCDYCGSMRVIRNGSCTVCEDCGGTSGCS